MKAVLDTLMLSVLLAVLALGAGISILWTFRTSLENDHLLSMKVSDVFKNPPLRMRKAIAFAFLSMPMGCGLVIENAIQHGIIEHYSRASEPTMFWIYVFYWTILGTLSLLVYIRKSKRVNIWE